MSKKNCWEVINSCEHGPDSDNPCIATKYEMADGYLGGDNGGRACFYIRGTLCDNEEEMSISDKLTTVCMDCEFFQETYKKEGVDCNIFYYLKFIHDKAMKLENLHVIEKVNLELFGENRPKPSLDL